MEKERFQNLLLRSAFACMACDGDIDEKEIELIKKLQEEEGAFGEVEIQKELQNLVEEINEKGKSFLQEHLSTLNKVALEEKEELELVRAALKVIESDEAIEYREIRFFKMIRSELQISDETIKKELEGEFPNLDEYLKRDILTDELDEGSKRVELEEFQMPQFGGFEE